jgi:hypothetical protein
MDFTSQEKLQLKDLMTQQNIQMQTEFIRSLKHSHQIREESKRLEQIRNEYSGDIDKIREEGSIQCAFLFEYYTDIFNYVKNNHVDMNLLDNFIDILKKIEDGEMDFEKASLIVKEFYHDCAKRKAKIQDNVTEETSVKKQEHKNISWQHYKKIQKAIKKKKK